MSKISHLNEKGEAHMVNVGEKEISKRFAIAEGIVRVKSTTIEKIKKNNLPKGDLFNTARIAGIMAAKKTSELIPLCHNLPISSVKIEIKLVKNDIYVLSTVKCEGKTGVEMEALTGVSVSCLTIYDMLKGLDKNAFITNIQLLEKSGGKSGDWKRK
ncbi:MAG: cyclic pyranopterin monophosphate synthase MoaC [Rhodobiaceae bacterium]|nr:cyclic pyranopterin monophosphate synthase MoaC [Rhodobiaceae bacterium]|tara:strand:+ start:2352 stop:2822 length:471 start_codon:yes stop_codon:yes gene_type:complete